MGGPRVPKKSEDFIIYIYDRLLRIKGKRPSAREVLEAAQAEKDTYKRDDIFLPKKRKAHDIIKSRRPEDGELLDEQEEIMRSRWSMAMLNDYPLPSESIPYVINVWRYACHVHEEFTIRQAKWASRLYRFRPDVTLLWIQSYGYALNEERHVKYNTDFETFFDDASLVMPDTELQTLLEVKHDNEPLHDIFNLGFPINKDNLIIEEALHPIMYYNALRSGNISNNRDKELIELLDSSDALASLKISTEMCMIYLRWFTHIRETSDWQRITAPQALDVIMKLREWISGLNSLRKVTHYSSDLDIKFEKGKAEVSFAGEPPKPNQTLKLLSEYAIKEEEK